MRRGKAEGQKEGHVVRCESEQVWRGRLGTAPTGRAGGGAHSGREMGVGDWGQRTWLPEVGFCNPGAQTFGFSPSCCLWYFSVPSLPNTRTLAHTHAHAAAFYLGVPGQQLGWDSELGETGEGAKVQAGSPLRSQLCGHSCKRLPRDCPRDWRHGAELTTGAEIGTEVSRKWRTGCIFSVP